MKKLSLICLSLVFLTALMGIGYANWSSPVVSTTTINTGNVDLEYFNNKNPGKIPILVQSDNGMDDPAEGIPDIANTKSELTDTDSDGKFDNINLTVSNAYHGYYDECDIWVRNNGSLPVRIVGAYITFNGQEIFMPTGEPVYLRSSGPYYPGSSPIADYLSDSFLEIEFGDNYNHIFLPNDKWKVGFSFLILDNAADSAHYNFNIRYVGELSPP
jgi:hypothetical protein